MNSRALAALKRQRHLTFETGEWIFLNPNTGQPFIDDRPMKRWIWTPTLRLLGLRHRACYQTRHTYATLMLMSGANPGLGSLSIRSQYANVFDCLCSLDKGSR